MRQIISLNRKWAFTKNAQHCPCQMPELPYWVNVPHSWNAIDGQDGAGDYYRGTCWYVKELDREEIPAAVCVRHHHGDTGGSGDPGPG